METNKLKQRVVIIISVLIVVVAFASCTKKIAFETSPIVPAARGYVKVKKDNNKNYAIEVSISNLAEVERLEGNNKSYVVWLISDNESPKNIGQINSGSGRFSKKLRASFHSVSTLKPTKIFITAEHDGTAQYPGNVAVLTTEAM